MMIKTNEPQDKALDCAVAIQEYSGFVGFAITVKTILVFMLSITFCSNEFGS